MSARADNANISSARRYAKKCTAPILEDARRLDRETPGDPIVRKVYRSSWHYYLGILEWNLERGPLKE